MTIKVAINGYGRIGRNILRAHYEDGKKHDLAIVAVNDLGSPETNAHLTRYDTAHGKFPGKVEVDGDAPVGFAAGNRLPEPKFELDAELSAVYLKRDYQRAGLGHRLVGAVVEAQRAQGATGMIVWTIAGNKPARAFYEQLDAELLIEQPFQWDGMDLVEAGYGWRDLSTLVAAAGLKALH